MMGKKDSQMQLMIIDIGTLVPESHLLRKIKQHIDFDFIYEKSAPYYSKFGRPSIDPVCQIKMLLIGYLYGIKSERRLIEDVSLNIAYRWFCGFDLTDKIPDHSLFSQNRRRRFVDSNIFNEIFNHVVLECGYINHETKQGLGYLTEMTADTDSGIVLGVDCYPANQRESSIILNHLDKIQTRTGVDINKLALDAGYDVGAVHRGLEILGITGYVSPIDFSYDILKRNVEYLPDDDCFECPAGKRLEFIKLTYKKSSQNYYRLYRMSAADRNGCLTCEHRKQCAFSCSDSRINASPFYPAFYRNRQRHEGSMYKAMKRLRGIWAEGAFAVLKREHNLARAKKRELHRVHEECLLSALALNLKRMVKALDKPVTVSNARVATLFCRRILRVFKFQPVQYTY